MPTTAKTIGDIAKHLPTPRLQGSVNVLAAMEVLDLYEIDILGVECEQDFTGVFSRGDFNKHVIRRNLNPANTALYEAMQIDTPYIPANYSVRQAYDAMLTYQWEYMPVVEARALCGIVSMRDLGQNMIQSYEDIKAENEMIISYIQNGESYAMADYKG